MYTYPCHAEQSPPQRWEARPDHSPSNLGPLTRLHAQTIVALAANQLVATKGVACLRVQFHSGCVAGFNADEYHVTWFLLLLVYVLSNSGIALSDGKQTESNR